MVYFPERGKNLICIRGGYSCQNSIIKKKILLPVTNSTYKTDDRYSVQSDGYQMGIKPIDMYTVQMQNEFFFTFKIVNILIFCV